MSSTSTLASKFLVFVPIALTVYYFDLPRIAQVFATPRVSSIVIASVLLFAFGLVIKRKIMVASLDISQPSFVWGTILLGSFVTIYFLGSYSPYTSIFRFDSFCILLMAYVAYRIGMRIIRATIPLIPVVLLGYPSASVDNPIVVYLFCVEAALLFWVYVGYRPRLMAFPLAFVGLGIISWILPVVKVEGMQVGTWPLVFLPVLALGFSRARLLAKLPAPVLSNACQVHRIVLAGFCTVCGRKIRRSVIPDRFAPWGLVAVLGVVAVLLLASVPILALNNNVPNDSKFTFSGLSGTITPTTPAGWQVNSSAPSSYGILEPYAAKLVYVPLHNPEQKNYTVYYWVASVPSVPSGPNGGEIPGWSRLSNNFTLLGPIQGYLTVYGSPGATLIAYQGKTTMTFLENGTIAPYYVGFGFVREFKNVNAGPDVREFLRDINTLWVPAINDDVYYSGWTAFLGTIGSGVYAVSTFTFATTTVLLISWAAYRARQADQKADLFMRRVARLSGEQWKRLTSLVVVPGRATVGFELFDGGAALPLTPDSPIRGLLDAHLIEQRVVEKGSELVLIWKAAQ